MNILLADNQDITKAGIRYLLSRISQELIVTEIKNKKGLISQLQQDERCAVILDFTSMDIESVDELLVIQSRFRPNRMAAVQLRVE
jgi:NarL family two-component system response regulator LiaR